MERSLSLFFSNLQSTLTSQKQWRQTKPEQALKLQARDWEKQFGLINNCLETEFTEADTKDQLFERGPIDS